MESSKMYSSRQCKNCTLPVRACKLPRLMWGSIGPRTEICTHSGLPFPMVPCLPQSNVYIKRKLRLKRVQKCIPLVGANTALTCASLQTTPSHVRRYRAENGNLQKLGLPFTMIPCLHQSDVYIKRKPWVWESKNVFLLLMQKPDLPVRACKLPHLMWSAIVPRTESCRFSGLPFAMVWCLHQRNVYIKRKLRVWRVEKCILLVGVKIALTRAGL